MLIGLGLRSDGTMDSNVGQEGNVVVQIGAASGGKW